MLIQDTSIFFNELEQAFKNKKPFVAYNKPNETTIISYVQKLSDLFVLKSFNQKGFVFSPFLSEKQKVFFPIEKCTISSTNFNNETLAVKNHVDELEIISFSKSKDDYIQLIDNTIQFIKQTSTDKVVISRKETLKKRDFNIFKTYKKMLHNYPGAFVYCWYHPKVGLWMGASPERFLNIENKQFKTMSLAGTQVFSEKNEVVWNEKEKEEQQFVTNFTLDNINGIADAIKTKGPYTVKAGNLVHLRTDISAKITSNQLIEDLVLKMHPTPAVCGLPKQEAKDFILKHEGYNRSFYTGFLGELNVANATNFYVNLRCMEIGDKSVAVYVGGGITAASIADKEWEETVSKSKVMKKVL